MTRWLVVQLRAPLVSFGGEAIDARGVTRNFPAASAVTGLLGNALGYERYETALLDRLQARLVFGARREAEPPLGRLTDFQTAQLAKDDQGWTTRGLPEGRSGGAATYDSPHIRYRDYHADAAVTVVLRLEPAEEAPNLDDLAMALDRPARPLFIGRKPCLPSAPMHGGFVEAPTARSALIAVPAAVAGEMRAIWPAQDDVQDADRIVQITDQRNWRSGLHGGARQLAEGRIRPVLGS
jgi:CRISPR system Cascade subunit CasD